MEAPVNGSPFEFTTPEYRLSTRGVRDTVSVDTWNGDSVADAVSEALDRAGTGGLVVGCIPFDTSAAAELHVPEEVTWRQRPVASLEDSSTTVCPEASRATVPVPEAGDAAWYRNAVFQAVQHIDSGELAKVVLGRTETFTADDPLDVEGIYGRLADDNPRAFVYRAPVADEATFLGATPELVLRSHGGWLTSMPLAGSLPRSNGTGTGEDSTTSDEELVERLRRDTKSLAEHSHVVDQVGEVFRRHADNVIVPEQPGVVQTPVIMHLGSRVTGKIRGADGAGDVLRMLYDLHPTPAVCGWPTGVARSLIGSLEPVDRGMHSGLVGWVDASGNAEWALALRGGLVQGAQATMFAGAGIVHGSDPELEHQETAAKFRTFSRAIAPQLQRPLTPTLS